MTPYETFAHSIDSRIFQPGEKALFTTDVKRNSNCWAKGIDLTCVSMLNGCTAISPQHVAMANHLGYSKGREVPFLTMASEWVRRTITATALVPGPQIHPQVQATDILIGTLDSPLPRTILPAYVLPPGVEPAIQNGYGLPALVLDQERKALITDVVSLAPPMVRLWRYSDANRAAYYEEKIGGDSGNPIFLIWNNVPVMLAHLLLGGAGAGPSYSHFYDAINGVMQGFSLHALDFRGVRPPIRDPIRPPRREPFASQ